MRHNKVLWVMALLGLPWLGGGIPAQADTACDFLCYMTAANEASLVMLHEQALLPPDLARDVGRGSAEREELLLLFDDDAILRSSDYRAWQEKTGNGFGFQLFFVAMPTVDSKHLWEGPEQFTWGRRALEPLKVTLNAGNSVTSGTHGIEMRGTPDSAGQRTLESQHKRRRR